MDVQGIGKSGRQRKTLLHILRDQEPATQAKLEYVQNNATKNYDPNGPSETHLQPLSCLCDDVDGVKVSATTGKGMVTTATPNCKIPRKENAAIETRQNIFGISMESLRAKMSWHRCLQVHM